MRAAAFLDRDGVVNVDRGYVFRPEDFAFVPGSLAAARALKAMDFALVVVTNQSGIARGYYTVADYEMLTEWMKSAFRDHGAALDAVYFCPHHPTEGAPPFRTECSCRKPGPGMLLQAARDLGIDLRRSIMFGDKASDLQAAAAAGVPHRVLLGTNGRGLPSEPAPAGLATASHPSLADAIESSSIKALLARLAGAATAQ